ncbi:hypothetical protein [Budvicia aquatica]|uniref:Uncharacterized protein n=1 Tax=Budvicia aquatica TaxID=82979 RepID=A0A484ZLI6_9GAMM|nr:hypothetical protein [Budvicia aquatica]VFS49065.1 Uncharacterised protein [Budvicia aquatica]
MTLMKSLSWKTSFATSVGIHVAVIVLMAILTLIHATSVGGTDMLTVELGGPAGNSGGFGDIQKEGRQGNAGEGGDGARNYAKERQQNDTPQEEAPKTDGEQMPIPFNEVNKWKLSRCQRGCLTPYYKI